MEVTNTKLKQVLLLALCAATLTGSLIGADKPTRERSAGGGRSEKSSSGGRSEKSSTGSRSEKSTRETVSKEKSSPPEKNKGMSESKKADRQGIDKEIAREKEAKQKEAMRDKSHDNRLKVGKNTSIGVGGGPAGRGINIKHTFGGEKKDK